MANADTYGLDITSIFSVGDSAGAHLLGMYAAVCTSPDYARNFDLSLPEGLRLAGLALNSGVYRIDLSAGGITSQLMADYLPQKGSREELDKLDVVSHITKDFPPCFVMTAQGDFLSEEPKILLPVLAQKGIPYEYRFYGDEAHPLGHVFHCNIRLDMAKKCNDEECAFFRSVLNQRTA